VLLTTPVLPTLTVQRRTGTVYRMRKEQILARALLPHHRLGVDEIADQLGVSGTPLKDARG